jgi:hypothetical protein
VKIYRNATKIAKKQILAANCGKVKKRMSTFGQFVAVGAHHKKDAEDVLFKRYWLWTIG